jgi:hypothetical protein
MEVLVLLPHQVQMVAQEQQELVELMAHQELVVVQARLDPQALQALMALVVHQHPQVRLQQMDRVVRLRLVEQVV